MTHPEDNSKLLEVAEIFKTEFKRASRQARESGHASPPEKISPVSLEDYRACCGELDVPEIFPDSLKPALISEIDNADVKILVNKYPGGKKMCLAIRPFSQAALPPEKEALANNEHFARIEVGVRGLTHGFFPDPGYYFLLLPAEIQNGIDAGGCSFQIPSYENPAYPSFTERLELKRRFENAFDNLKRLVEKNVTPENPDK